MHGYAPIVSVGDIALMDKGAAGVYVPISDQVGTIWDLLNPGASKANDYGYDAFGVGRSVSESLPDRYRFGTKRHDSDSALYHFVARQFQSRIGRFSASDPVRLGSFPGCADQNECSRLSEFESRNVHGKR